MARSRSCFGVYGITAVILAAATTFARADGREQCLAQLVPAVDIGHHLSSPGTLDVFGRAELFYNADLANQLVLSLSELGFRRIVLINRSLNERSLESRPRQALCEGAGVFMSIHHDNVDESKKAYSTIDGKRIGFNDEIDGYTIYFSSKNVMAELSKELALAISDEFNKIGIPSANKYQAFIADRNRKLVNPELNIWDYEGLVVLKYSTIPSILIEAGFLSNRHDIDRLKDAAFRKRLSDAIARATLTACISDGRLTDIASRVAREQIRQCDRSHQPHFQ